MRQAHRHAFTLIELLVVIAIIALLIGLLLPVLGSARTAARGLASLSNVRQIAVAAQAYTADHRGFHLPFSNAFGFEPYTGSDLSSGAITTPPLPERSIWPTTLLAGRYLPGIRAFLCPELETTRDPADVTTPQDSPMFWKLDPGWYKVHYGMNFTFLGSALDVPTVSSDPPRARRPVRAASVEDPSATHHFADAKNLAMQRGTPALGNTFGYSPGETAGIAYLFPGAESDPNRSYGHADARHQNSINVASADGHAAAVQIKDPTQIWGPDELTDWTDPINRWDRR